MRFELILDLGLICEYYGDVPETSGAPSQAYETYVWPQEDQSLFANDFVVPINSLCGTALDIYDVDWFDARGCALLRDWLEARLQQPCAEALRTHYLKLLDFAPRATELGTGVVVEL